MNTVTAVCMVAPGRQRTRIFDMPVIADDASLLVRIFIASVIVSSFMVPHIDAYTAVNRQDPGDQTQGFQRISCQYLQNFTATFLSRTFLLLTMWILTVLCVIASYIPYYLSAHQEAPVAATPPAAPQRKNQNGSRTAEDENAGEPENDQEPLNESERRDVLPLAVDGPRRVSVGDVVRDGDNGTGAAVKNDCDDDDDGVSDAAVKNNDGGEDGKSGNERAALRPGNRRKKGAGNKGAAKKIVPPRVAAKVTRPPPVVTEPAAKRPTPRFQTRSAAVAPQAASRSGANSQSPPTTANRGNNVSAVVNKEKNAAKNGSPPVEQQQNEKRKQSMTPRSPANRDYNNNKREKNCAQPPPESKGSSGSMKRSKQEQQNRPKKNKQSSDNAVAAANVISAFVDATKTYADATKCHVDLAKKNAERVKKIVEPVKKIAESVKKNAEPAKKNTELAKKNTELAKKNAKPLITNEDLVKTNASLAKTNAILAKTSANLAKTTALLAKTSANLAKSYAELVKTYADAAKAELPPPLQVVKDTFADNLRKRLPLTEIEIWWYLNFMYALIGNDLRYQGVPYQTENEGEACFFRWPYPRRVKRLNPDAKVFHLQLGATTAAAASVSPSYVPQYEQEQQQQHNGRRKSVGDELTSCVRCASFFSVEHEHEYAQPGRCQYHCGKLRGEVPFTSWGCCYKSEPSPGCVSANSHVWNGFVDGYNGPVSGFVSTARSANGGPMAYWNGLIDPNDTVSVYGLDCEMCYTWRGLEVTRVTLVDVSGTVVYDTLVRPARPIVDYNTRFSGISAEDFERKPYVTLEKAQRDLLRYINANTLLVGHGLGTDLLMLRFIHQRVIDTSVLYAGPQNFKRSLRHLALCRLYRQIQTSYGHDSKEDARAAMDLALYRLHHDIARGDIAPLFGVGSIDWQLHQPGLKAIDIISLFTGIEFYMPV